jgi:integrase
LESVARDDFLEWRDRLIEGRIDAAQRKAIIAAASPAAARFFRGFELTGARPKELAATRVADFNGQRLRLAHRKGRPVKLRPRHVVLSAEAVEFFKAQSKDKLPSAPLFTEDGETPWRRHACARAILTVRLTDEEERLLARRAAPA